MRIIYLVPGAGGTFYCQNCLRDVAVARGLRRRGHDVTVVPMYLPVTSDDAERLSTSPVFYGAVRIFLEQKAPWLRRMPAALGRFLDAPPLLGLAAAKAGSTRARGHEAMTLSMLKGEDGRQASELERLAAWLTDLGAPLDVVHLSNALLLGLARELKRRLGAAVVCSLQDEDLWVDAMAPALSPRVWEAMAERAADVDAFVAVSRYYAERVRNRLRVPAARLHVVPVGIDPQGHRPAALPFDPPVVGYLSRISESQGFGLLVEAFRLLKQHPRLAGLKLAATGGLTGDDRRFARRVRRRLAARGWEGDLELLPEFDRDRRLQLLQSLTVLSVPALRGEAFGTYLLEAMASGVPVVQPRLGAFPEIIEAAGGGVLYEPNTPAALAAALQSLLLSPERARELGRRGREGVVAHFGTEKMVTDLEGVYKGVAREV